MACEVGVLNTKHIANSLPTFQQMKEEIKSNLHAALCTFAHATTNLWAWVARSFGMYGLQAWRVKSNSELGW
jgi:predicted component of type VI protein secretion system